MKWILLLAVAALFAACYRMPSDDDYCLIPATNNPSVTGAAPSSPMPSTSY